MRLSKFLGPIVANERFGSGNLSFESEAHLQFTTEFVPNSLLVIRLGFKFPIAHSKCFNVKKLCAGKDKGCLLEMGFGPFGHLACSHISPMPVFLVAILNFINLN